MDAFTSLDQTADAARAPAAPLLSGDAASVTVRYWAGARAAAGVETEPVPAGTAADIVAEAVRRHPALAPIAPLCALLWDGRRLDPATDVTAGATVEMLPPFAGG